MNMLTARRAPSGEAEPAVAPDAHRHMSRVTEDSGSGSATAAAQAADSQAKKKKKKTFWEKVNIFKLGGKGKNSSASSAAIEEEKTN